MVFSNPNPTFVIWSVATICVSGPDLLRFYSSRLYKEPLLMTPIVRTLFVGTLIGLSGFALGAEGLTPARAAAPAGPARPALACTNVGFSLAPAPYSTGGVRPVSIVAADFN